MALHTSLASLRDMKRAGETFGGKGRNAHPLSRGGFFSGGAGRHISPCRGAGCPRPPVFLLRAAFGGERKIWVSHPIPPHGFPLAIPLGKLVAKKPPTLPGLGAAPYPSQEALLFAPLLGKPLAKKPLPTRESVLPFLKDWFKKQVGEYI